MSKLHNVIEKLDYWWIINENLKVTLLFRREREGGEGQF